MVFLLKHCNSECEHFFSKLISVSSKRIDNNSRGLLLDSYYDISDRLLYDSKGFWFLSEKLAIYRPDRLLLYIKLFSDFSLALRMSLDIVIIPFFITAQSFCPYN